MLRLRRHRGPRARLARLRAVPLAMLSIWLSVGLLAALALLDLVAHRMAGADEERDAAWISVLHMRELKAELLRPARGMLDRALEGGDPARIDWRPPAEAGLLVAIEDANGFRLLARPPAFDAAGQPLPRLVRAIKETHDPLPVGEVYCLPLPDADVARLSRTLAVQRGAKVAAAACFGTESIGKAAEATLPRSGELTFWRDRRSLVRVGKDRLGKLSLTAGPGLLAGAVRDRPAGDGADLSLGPFGAWDLLVHGGSTVGGSVQAVEEDRQGDPALVHYLGGPGREVTGWTGYSFTLGDPPPRRSQLGPWTAGLLAAHAAVVLALAFWSWRVVGRLTRRWQRRR